MVDKRNSVEKFTLFERTPLSKLKRQRTVESFNAPIENFDTKTSKVERLNNLESNTKTIFHTHEHKDHEHVKVLDNIPKETGPQRDLSNGEKIKYFVTGILWGGVSLFVFALDNLTGHVLDGLLLDLIYVVAGVVSSVQLRAALKGHTSSDLTFRGQKKRLTEKIKKFFTRKKK